MSSIPTPKSGMTTRRKSIVNKLFTPMTTEERVKKTEELLNTFLGIKRANGRFETDQFPISFDFEVKGDSHGSGFFQIRLDDLYNLVNSSSGWKSVFEAKDVELSLTVATGNHKGSGWKVKDPTLSEKVWNSQDQLLKLTGVNLPTTVLHVDAPFSDFHVTRIHFVFHGPL